MHPIVPPRLEYSSFPSPGCSVCPEVISRYNYCPCCVFCCVLFFSRFVSNSIIQEDNLRWKLLFCSHRQYHVPPLQSFSRAFSDQWAMSASVMTSANLPSLMLPYSCRQCMRMCSVADECKYSYPHYSRLSKRRASSARRPRTIFRDQITLVSYR